MPKFSEDGAHVVSGLLGTEGPLEQGRVKLDLGDLLARRNLDTDLQPRIGHAGSNRRLVPVVVDVRGLVPQQWIDGVQDLHGLEADRVGEPSAERHDVAGCVPRVAVDVDVDLEARLRWIQTVCADQVESSVVSVLRKVANARLAPNHDCPRGPGQERHTNSPFHQVHDGPQLRAQRLEIADGREEDLGARAAPAGDAGKVGPHDALGPSKVKGK